MSGPLPPLRADGERVWVATVHEADVVPYMRAVARSAERIREWNPVDPGDLAGQLERQSSVHRTFVIHARKPVGDHAIVGIVNVSNVVRGRFQSATMGYNSYDPYAGTGLFAEGMRVLLGLVFTAEPYGMGLHRLEANVQPANVRSAGLLRSIGFRRERHMKRMLWLEGAGRPASWRDHDSYAITAEEHPVAYRPNDHPRITVVVESAGGPSPTARDLACELGVPVLSDAVLSPEQTAAVLADAAGGAVLEIGSGTTGSAVVDEILRRADVQPERVLFVHAGATGPAAIARIALEARALALG